MQSVDRILKATGSRQSYSWASDEIQELEGHLVCVVCKMQVISTWTVETASMGGGGVGAGLGGIWGYCDRAAVVYTQDPGSLIFCFETLVSQTAVTLPLHVINIFKGYRILG